MMEKKFIMLLIILVFLIIISIIQKSQIFAVLPEGQYNSNSDCSFITNADYQGEQEIGDFGGAGQWISIDWDKDGFKEGYGFVCKGTRI